MKSKERILDDLDQTPTSGPTPIEMAPASPKKDFVAGLNDRQKEAVLYNEGPLLVLAGAGSGKTKLITHKMAYLIEELGYVPSSILAITFTNKAAKEMKERLYQLIGPLARLVRLGTFHSQIFRILRNHADILGFTREITIADTDQQTRIMKGLRAASRFQDMEQFSVNNLLRLFSTCKNQYIGPMDSEAFFLEVKRYNRQDAHELALLFAQYQEALWNASSLDFDDILYFGVKLFLEHPDLLEAYQKRFAYILVDEYQDTNQVQYQWIHLLAKAHKKICVVGDDDQSIYSFRGADHTIILNFEEDWPGCRTVRLEQNYRSTGNILKAANAVIKKNDHRKPKKLWTTEEDGPQLLYMKADNAYMEARWIADEIDRLIRRGVDPGELAVLYRLNFMSRQFEAALRRKNVPFHIVSGLPFYARKEIRDVLAYLQLALNPDHQPAFDRVYNEPRRGLGKKAKEDLDAYCYNNGDISPLAALREWRDGNLTKMTGYASYIRFLTLIEEVQAVIEADQLGLAQLVDYVIHQSGIYDSYAKKAEVDQGMDGEARGRTAKDSDDDPQARLMNLEELVRDAHEFVVEQEVIKEEFEARHLTASLDFANDPTLDEEDDPTMGANRPLKELLAAFLNRIALATSADLEGGSTVSLMTVHASKGLEFPYVFIGGLLDGKFPIYSRSAATREEFEEDLEEERRLFYVALTRAGKQLYLSSYRENQDYSRYGRQTSGSCDPSCFLADIPDSCIVEIAGSRKKNTYSTNSMGATNRMMGIFPGRDTGMGERRFGGRAYGDGGRGTSDSGRGGPTSSLNRTAQSHSQLADVLAESRKQASLSGYNPFQRANALIEESLMAEQKAKARPKNEAAVHPGQKVTHTLYGDGVVTAVLAGDIVMINFAGETKPFTKHSDKLTFH
mgnify:CR=1 FL=1